MESSEYIPDNTRRRKDLKEPFKFLDSLIQNSSFSSEFHIYL